MAQKRATAPQWAEPVARSRYIERITRMTARESTTRVATHPSKFRRAVAHQIDDHPAAWELPT